MRLTTMSGAAAVQLYVAKVDVRHPGSEVHDVRVTVAVHGTGDLRATAGGTTRRPIAITATGTIATGTAGRATTTTGTVTDASRDIPHFS